jgi:ketosteroid isomerase-like protein
VSRSLAAALAAGIALAGALGAPACRSSRPATFATASAVPSGPRLPDGVALDREGALPAAGEEASSDQAVAALREPSDPSGALATVRAFFSAVSREDMTALKAALSPDASLSALGGGPSPLAEPQWERRMSKLDYLALGHEPVYRESEVEVYQSRDLELAEGDRPARPPTMAGGDVYVRVPIETRRVGTERLFGDEIGFVLRRSGGTYRIRAMFEDFQAP